MARDARRKERHRLKRKQKQQAQRKAKSVTAIRKVALAGGTLECLANPPDWKDEGIVSIVVLARTPGGRCAAAAFLVDLWCVGLKDAWGKSETSADYLQDLRDRTLSRGAVHMSPEQARRLVAGGVRFSRENGFRLPDHWQKWVSVFGEMGPPESLDMRHFGVEGEGKGKKLRYVGTEQFLRSRLVGSTLEAFVARPDVEVVIGDVPPGEFDDYDEEGEESEESEEGEETLDEEAAGLADMLMDTVANTAGEIRKWCFARGLAPHPRLDEAAQLLLVALLPAMAHAEAVANGELPESQAPPDRSAAIEQAIAAYPPRERAEMKAAVDQVTIFMQSFDDPASMLEAMGLKPFDEEEAPEEAR